MNNKLFKWLLLPLALLVFTLSSCDLAQDETKDSIVGTWADEWTTLEISETQLGGTGTNGDIVKITDTSKETGYFVFQYTKSYNTSLIGKFGVVKWKELTDSTVSTSEGFKASNPDADMSEWIAITFDTADGAEAGMDDSFFGFYSPLEKQ